MRRLVHLGIGIITLVLPLSPARATATSALLLKCVYSQSGDQSIDSDCDEPGSTDTTATPVSTSSSGTSGSSRTYVPYDRLTTGPDGLGCVTTGYIEQGTTPTDAAPPDLGDHIIGAGGYNNIYAEYPPCPEQPRAPGQPAQLVTRAMLAARYWERTTLPSPAPFVAPGRAISGKLAYLETRGELVRTYRSDTPFGPLSITAKGRYLIDWGDGQTSGPYDVEGAPWPYGQITHEYLDIGKYDIVVTEKWLATWSLDGESGILRTLQSIGRINDFPVQQIQAVVGR